MRLMQIAFSFLMLHSASINAAADFHAFPVPSYTGPFAKARLTDVKSRQYAAHLRSAEKGPVNFAGSGMLAMWGCGASCIMAASVDAKTGNVAWLPFTVCCWSTNISEPLEFRADSRLLVVHGSRDETGPGSAVHYYTFDGKKFSELLTRDDAKHH
jgi:hypothetical protein